MWPEKPLTLSDTSMKPTAPPPEAISKIAADKKKRWWGKINDLLDQRLLAMAERDAATV